MKSIWFFLFLFLGFQTLNAQEAPFHRGVNLTNWFQANNARQIHFTKYTRQDFEQIKSLGCDVVRLPINLHFMTDGAPDYVLDPLFLSFLDQGMPVFPSSLRGSWIESAFNNYRNEGTVARVKQLIDIAVQFRDNRNAPIFCGEFGVYIPNSNNEDRVFWYETVRSYLEEKNIAWTAWDYHGGFGLFEEGGNGLFEHDLNAPLLEAMGFNVPEQTEYVMQPERKGFYIYSDYIGEGIFEESYNDGIIDFYSPDEPNNDQHCLYWTDALQYNNIGFDFRPNKDLSELVDSNYALDLMVRGDTPGTRFDIRFLDTKTNEPNDRPWRMRVTLDENDLAGDSRWTHLHIPLKNFTEQGAWDNGWYNPEGKFDWTAIDRFEIVAEHATQQDVKLWFDNIHITNLDTALVYVSTPFNDSTTPTAERYKDLDLKIFPNPAGDYVRLDSPYADPLQYLLLDGIGRPLRKAYFTGQTQIDLSDLPKGFYLLQLRLIERQAESRASSGFTSRKLIKN